MATRPSTDCDLVAFYLPQFHPIPENDAWWGTGFTEWTNVVPTRPRFRGHYQPHLPGELGFYDLRVSDTRERQAELAAEHGIGAFCYYHYWFNGRRLLERPLNEVVQTGRPDFPFLLCWANENWTRRWDGGSAEVLVEQTYSPEDDLAHIRWLIPRFEDPRYFRYEGKPVFVIYRTTPLPDVRRTIDQWRTEARKAGLGELYLVRVDGHEDDVTPDLYEQGYDAATEWIPDFTKHGEPLRRTLRWKVSRRLGLSSRAFGRGGVVLPYDRVVDDRLRAPATPYRRHRCVTVSWDNSPRRAQSAFVLTDPSPESYRRWLAGAIAASEPGADGRKLVFINAWNEWAEGNHLEPDLRFGRAYLEATRAALLDTQ